MTNMLDSLQDEAFQQRLREVTYGNDAVRPVPEIGSLYSYAMVKEAGGGAVAAGATLTVSGANYLYSDISGASTAPMPDESIWLVMGVLPVGGVTIAFRQA